MVESESAMESRETESRPPDAFVLPRCVWWFGSSALMSWWLYVALVWLSTGFKYETPGLARPLLSTLAVFAVLFGLYLIQIAFVIKRRMGSEALTVIVVFAVAFRVLLLFSEPIQEVDAYRYLWDGKAVAAGVNPYRYSPEHVLTANEFAEHPADLNLLISVRDRSAANAQILARVHFGQLTTVYPPVSQCVFTAAAVVTPDAAPVATQMLVIKSFIVAFDLATLWMLILLLKFVGRPPQWSVVYAWCPLVLKEFANSGHLDSIAVFLTVAAVYCGVRAFFPRDSEGKFSSSWSPTAWTFLAATVLSLAVGAKIYPIVLAPLLFLSAWHRISRAIAVSAGVISLVFASLMVAPMLFREPAAPINVSARDFESPPIPTAPSADEIPPPLQRSGSKIDDTATGLAAFAGQWQMNDFLFLLVFENLKPGAPVTVDDSPQQPPACKATWFVVTSEQWRQRFITTMASHTQLSPDQIPFLVTRLLTGGVFLLLATWFASQGMKSADPTEWLRMVFLTIAWFWLLQPTQNPWYWTWALPFLPFARSRAWLVMSGLVLMYYARFWFSYHMAATPVLGTPYTGTNFFDEIVTWIEYCPWMVWLIWTWRTRGAGRRAASGNAGNE